MCHHFTPERATYLSLAENQKGITSVQRYTSENQKGNNAIDFL